MTAEVAVMNAQAVALAADSAVSIDGSEKSFTSADKIFALSAWEPIAAMIHGNASFMGIPWETIIKGYRRQLGTKCFPAVADYARHFAQYLERDASCFFPEEVRDKQARQEIRARLEPALNDVNAAIKICIDQQGSVTEERIAMYVAVVIAALHHAWSEARLVPGLSENRATELAERYAEDALLVQDDILKDYPLTEQAAAQLADLRRWFLTRVLQDDETSHTSGVVFAGFGVTEHFPNIVEYRFEGIVEKVLRYSYRTPFEVSRSQQAGVYAFGQEDMVQTFMDGIDPEFKDQVSHSVNKFIVGYSDVIIDAVPNLPDQERQSLKERFRRLGNEAFVKYRQSLKTWRRREHAQKTLEVIATLPKDELATVAESLVSLTSLKRRVSQDASVSPPIDVCVISKHDGCVWVRKKHYFPIELNPSFYTRYGHLSKLSGTEEDERASQDEIQQSGGDSEKVLSRPSDWPPSNSRT